MISPLRFSRSCGFALLGVLLSGSLRAQTAATPAPVRPVPPPGVAIPDGDRSELEAGAVALGKDITILHHNLQSKPEMLALLPDVMIFHKAVDWALRYNEFFNVKQVATAKKLLELGSQRLSELKEGKPSWISATGLVPRGYISKIDGSVQPYGMVIPEDWKPGETPPRRLDFWCHGRGENLSELSFIDQRLTSKGDYTPPGVLVLHLYGRFCCANKFAGETDLFEALANAKTHYNIDPQRLVVRGFSMGGGAAWQFGTHFAGMWAAVQPGAGFADTREFQKLGTSPDKPLPPEWEQTLWEWYDSKDWVTNLADTTTVAYSGEIDGQKAAADIMIRCAREAAGDAHPPVAVLGKVAPGDGSPKADEARVTGTGDIPFYHVIALQTPHKIKAEEKPEVDSLVEAAVTKHVEGLRKVHWTASGVADKAVKDQWETALPPKVHFTTYTLIYPNMDWITVRGMDKEWERADVDADISNDAIIVKTRNVSWLGLEWMPHKDWLRHNPGVPPGQMPANIQSDLPRKFVIDGQQIDGALNSGSLVKENGQWGLETKQHGEVRRQSLNKGPDLCGPIDHAFMSSFVFVRPTGQPLNEKIGAWTKGELEHATGFWRKVFRGDAPIKDDTAITDKEIKNSNLVLWGDPSSNAVLAKIISKLPLQWSGSQLSIAGQTYETAHTVPLLIFPNPLNPSKYVVLNSGPTFREFALLNNTDQTAKLPDWAIVDVNTPPDAKWPGEVKAAGFFDEQWKLPSR